MDTKTEFNIIPCNKDNIKVIVDGINDYNLSKVPAIASIWTPLEFVAKDENGLEIKILWVKEGYRKKGVGSQILKHTEAIAIQKGAEIAMLDTFDFQAEQFYLKNGYQAIGEIKDFPKGHKRIYFSKKLTK